MLDLPGLSDALRSGGRDLDVLVVRLGAMGDVLRTVPPVRLLRAALPQATLRWVVDAPWLAVLEGHPDLDGCVAVPRSRWRAALRRPWSWPSVASGVTALRRELRRPVADLALDFHGNLRSGVVLALSGATVRLGHDGHQQKEGNRRFTTHRVPAGERRRSRIERGLDLVRALGLPDAPLPPCDLPLVARGRADASPLAERAGGAGAYGVLAPGASLRQAYKMPPAVLLAAAARRLGELGLGALVVWGPGERDAAEAVAELAPGSATIAPRTSLAELAGLIASARLFVGGDSGPLHLACAAGCPVVGLYGPTDPDVNTPWGVPFERVWPDGRAYTGVKRMDREAGGFEGLGPETVVAAVDRLLERTGVSPT